MSATTRQSHVPSVEGDGTASHESTAQAIYHALLFCDLKQKMLAIMHLWLLLSKLLGLHSCWPLRTRKPTRGLDNGCGALLTPKVPHDIPRHQLFSGGWGTESVLFRTLSQEARSTKPQGRGRRTASASSASRYEALVVRTAPSSITLFETRLGDQSLELGWGASSPPTGSHHGTHS